LPNQGSMAGRRLQPFVFRQKLVSEDGSVRRGDAMVKQPGLFPPTFGATSYHVFGQSPQNVVVEPGIHSLDCWDQCFALPQLLHSWGHQSGIFWLPPRIPSPTLKRFSNYIAI
jgi:hypothetical protein